MLYYKINNRILILLLIFSILFFYTIIPVFANVQEKIDTSFIKNAKKIEGIFNIYKYKNKYYLEIPKGKVNKEYFVSLQIAKGISVYPFLGGLTLPVFEPFGDYTQSVYFSFNPELENEQRIDVSFYVKNHRYRANFDDPSSKLLQKSFSDNLIFKTKGTILNDNIYIDLNNFCSNLNLSINFPLISKTINGKIEFNELKDVKNYPNNMVLYLSYLVSFKPTFSYINSLNLTSNNELILGLNIFSYENINYKPREYDERVGYFATTYSDISSTEGKDGYRTIKKYINRWDLDNKKLTIWIENTWPEKYRETVKEGILEWNKAFNKIGYSDPIEVKIQPNDANWEPEDIRYCTVRYQDASNTAFAIGPSIALPTTGEIIDADIVFYAPMLRVISSRFDYYYEVAVPNMIKYQFNPLYRIYSEFTLKNNGINLNELLSTILNIKEDLGDLKNIINENDVCTYAIEKMENVNIALTSILLSNPSYFNINKEKFVKDYVKDIIIHEVGHILGLRHNFKSSSFISIDQLQDENFTSKNGISYSCMDYNPVNIHFKNGKPYFTNDLFMTTIGYYDYLAIEYGYTKDDSSLKAIASKAGIYYGPDEDLYAFDPNIRKFDLSSQGYKWYQDYSNILKYIIDNSPYKLSKVGNNPRFVYWATRGALNSYISSKLENLLYYLSGKNIHRFYFGDQNRKNVELLNSSFRDFVADSIIKDLSNHNPIMNPNSLLNSISFGFYEWGTTNIDTRTLIDTAYLNERIYRTIAILALLLPLSSKYEYYYDQEITSKNMRKLYYSLFDKIDYKKDISQIKQQSIEDFVYILLFINGYSKFNSSFDILFMNIIYLPKVRNESIDIIEKIKEKMKLIKNNPLSTKQNKLFASRILNLIEISMNE